MNWASERGAPDSLPFLCGDAMGSSKLRIAYARSAASTLGPVVFKHSQAPRARGETNSRQRAVDGVRRDIDALPRELGWKHSSAGIQQMIDSDDAQDLATPVLARDSGRAIASECRVALERRDGDGKNGRALSRFYFGVDVF